jgi:hypothetical protein
MVEPTIFGRAEPSQSSSKLDLLEPSWAQQLKFDIDRAELSPKPQIWYWLSQAISSNFPSHQSERAKRINQTCTKLAQSVGCDTILPTDSDNLYYIHHYFNRFLGWLNLGQHLLFFLKSRAELSLWLKHLKWSSWAEPKAQNLEMIELSWAGQTRDY